MKRTVCWAVLAMITLLAGGACFGGDLTARERTEVVDQVCSAIERNYVFPDKAKEMADHVRARLKAGDYDQFSELEPFTQRLTSDLRSVSKDLHLGVVTLPDGPGPEPGESPERRRERMRDRMRRDNFGFEKVERLSGNVGYLDLRGFFPAELAGDTAVAAMNFLANSDAVIIDLRRNGGGNPSMIQLISSYFFEEPKHLNSFYVRSTDSLDQFWSAAWVPGKRMTDVDLYVLTSRRTFSAAEEFTYNMKNLKRAKIVGETTGGGAHPTDFHPLPELGVGVSIPFGRAVNPVTQTNWEGTGVAPDIEVPQEKALDTAHRLALEKLAAKASDEETKASLEWALEVVKARENPVQLPSELLQGYAGSYGERQVTFERGRLLYRRGDGPQYVLIPADRTRFLLEGLDDFRLEFELDSEGNPTAVVGHYAGGRSDRSPRDME